MLVPHLGRRLLAIVYDALLLAAVLFVAAVPWILLENAISHAAKTQPGWRLAFQLYLLTTIFLFFGWFWTHGGQTLGMRAWRLRLIDPETGADISWRQAAIRFAGALLSAGVLGLGYLWAIVDRDHRCWHDRLSGTRLILLPKTAARPGRRIS